MKLLRSCKGFLGLCIILTVWLSLWQGCFRFLYPFHRKGFWEKRERGSSTCNVSPQTDCFSDKRHVTLVFFIKGATCFSSVKINYDATRRSKRRSRSKRFITQESLVFATRPRWKRRTKLTMKNAVDALGQEIRKDVLSNEVMNGFECQRPFESQLLQKKRTWSSFSNSRSLWIWYSLLCEPVQWKDTFVHERYFHTPIRNTDDFVGQPHLVRALEEGQKSGAPSAKMTQHADLGLKMLFRTNSSTLLKVAQKWCAQCENDKTCWCRAENIVLHKLVALC